MQHRQQERTVPYLLVVAAVSQKRREEPQTRTCFVPSFACRSGQLNLPYIIVTRCRVSLRFFFLRYLEELLRLSELDDGDTIQMPEALLVSDPRHAQIGLYSFGYFSIFLSFVLVLLSLFCLFLSSLRFSIFLPFGATVLCGVCPTSFQHRCKNTRFQQSILTRILSGLSCCAQCAAGRFKSLGGSCGGSTVDTVTLVYRKCSCFFSDSLSLMYRRQTGRGRVIVVMSTCWRPFRFPGLSRTRVSEQQCCTEKVVWRP